MPNNDEKKSPACAGDANAIRAINAAEAAVLHVNEKPAMIHLIYKRRLDLEQRP